MPKKNSNKIPFEEYREKLEYYRVEFLKRSNQAEQLKAEYLNYFPSVDPESISVLWPEQPYSFKRQGQEPSDAWNLKFSFIISRLATVEEVIEILDKVKKDTLEIWEKHRSNINRQDFIKNHRGGKFPFESWERILNVYDARQLGKSLKEIGQTCYPAKPVIEAKEKKVSDDLKTAKELIEAAANGYPPFDT